MNEETVKEFLVESYENLDRLDRDFVALEKDPHDAERLASVFRTIHTIKGTCGFLAFSKLESVSHVGESLLVKIRDGRMTLDAAITTALLAMVDAIREILASIESTGAEGNGDYTHIITELARLNELEQGSATAKGGTTARPAGNAAAPVATLPIEPPSAVAVEPVYAASAEQVHDQSATSTADASRTAPGVSDSSLRVDVSLLDKLMNLVGELVLARNQILQFTATQTDSSFVGATQRLNLVASELQEGVMKMRMQPIGNIWGRFPRIVRDLATQCGKQVRVEMEGKETDLDKTVIEAIKDPLTHLVRNSVDHGIETPAARLAAGKPAEGLLRMHAFHEGGQINIEISDDGAGIDPERIKSKALQRGMITADQAARMSEHELVRLVFLPGFSTAQTVSNISGRGVGMDVVKTNIEKIGGQVDIQSRLGRGTTLRIKIPLTLAIIPALIVGGGDGERYAIPQVSLLELVRLDASQQATGIERIQDALFYRLRGDLLPLVYLNEVLGLPSCAGADDAVNIVVLKADDRQFGLVVHEINDTEEIVVKPLGSQLKGVTTFAGATIMGDGRVALILDVLGIAQRGHVVSKVRDRALADVEARTGDGDDGGDLETLLLFRVGASDRMAMPLSLVARLEEFHPTQIETLGDRQVVQYRGEILPLVSLARHFTGTAVASDSPCQVIVFSENGRQVGLVVEQILDIVTERVKVQGRARSGVRGSAVVQQRVTDLVDVPAVLRAADPQFYEAQAAA